MHSPSRSLRVVAGSAAVALTLSVGTAAAAVDAPTPGGDLAPLVGASAPDVIPGAYIVVLADGARDTGATASVRAAAAGGTVSRTYDTALHGYAAALTPAALAAVRSDPAVAYVEVDREVSLEPSVAADPSIAIKQQGATWGLDRIDQKDLPLNEVYRYNKTGAGVHAYVIDTGILMNHEDFGGRAVSGVDIMDGDDDATDCNGHGSHVAGTIGGTKYGVAKEVTLVGVRVLDCAGFSTVSLGIAGIDWVAANAVLPAVANMSLRFQPTSAAMEEALNAASDVGVVFAVSAGNASTDACGQSPADAKRAITVGATNKNDAQAWFSNYGTCVDIYAPGDSITSAGIKSPTDTAVLSGTSMAAPHVAGVASLYLGAHPTATVKEVTRELKQQSTKNTLTGLGPESPNKMLFSRVK